MLEPAFEMALALLRAGLLGALVRRHRPFAHHGVGDVGVELQAERLGADLDRLGLEIVALGQQDRAIGAIEALAMPLIDAGGEGAVTKGMALLGRADRIIADLDAALRMGADRVAEMARQQLRAEADAQKGLVFAKRRADPVDFALEPVVLVVDAHRAAENHRAGMIAHGLGQGVAETGAADVERRAEFAQQAADSTRRTVLAVQDDQHGLMELRGKRIGGKWHFQATSLSLAVLLSLRRNCSELTTASERALGVNGLVQPTNFATRPGTTTRLPAIMPS